VTLAPGTSPYPRPTMLQRCRSHVQSHVQTSPGFSGNAKASDEFPESGGTLPLVLSSVAAAPMSSGVVAGSLSCGDTRTEIHALSSRTPQYTVEGTEIDARSDRPGSISRAWTSFAERAMRWEPEGCSRC
jgi:hypothetical protein